MDWVTSIHQAIQYIEEHLREELTIREIAQQAALSPFYFQKGFAMLCGMTVGDYIRQRRLSAAGLEVLTTDRKIIDIALEFGYDSPDSFTRAFARFHGLTPAALRKSGGAVRSFAPLRIKVTLEGGQNMDCKIMKKEAFTVLCRAKTFKYEDAVVQVPQFWAEHFGTGGGKVVCGMYGINLDESMGGNEFEYLIADNYDPAREIPDGFTTRTIPAHTWAVFPCTGRMPQAANECVVHVMGYQAEITEGTVLTLPEDTEGTKHKEYTVVGLVQDPQHISTDKESSTVGNGQLNYIAYVLDGELTADYYTACYIKAENADRYDNYSQE